MIEALTYDDVLLLPHYSDIRSRSEVDISTDLGNGLKLSLLLSTDTIHQKNKPSWLDTQESTEQRTLALPLVLVETYWIEHVSALTQVLTLFVLMWHMVTIS